jgi:NADPH-dependent curcumin reductase CurA
MRLARFLGGSCINNRQNNQRGNVMSGSVNRQILLVEKPSGKLGPEHFKMIDGAMPEPKDGEALLRVRYISLDAANRAGCTARRIVRPSRPTA